MILKVQPKSFYDSMKCFYHFFQLNSSSLFTYFYAFVLAPLRSQLQQMPWSALSVFCWCLFYKKYLLHDKGDLGEAYGSSFPGEVVIGEGLAIHGFMWINHTNDFNTFPGKTLFAFSSQ